MKEIMAVIRINKINETKSVLSEAGFPSATCRMVYGRGAKKVNFELIEDLLDGDMSAPKETMETLSESHRLIAKRMLTMMVQDDEVEKAVDLIIETNQTGSMGDGKIFVMPITDTIRVRTGERGEAAL